MEQQMKNQQTIERASHYNKFKTNVLSRSIETGSCYLDELEMLSDRYARFRDSVYSITPGAFQQLMKALEIPPEYINRFSRLMGDDARDALIYRTQKAMSVSKTNVNITIDFDEHTIISITPQRSPCLPTDLFFDTVEKVVDKNELNFFNTELDMNGGVSITALSRDQFSIDGLEDEEHKWGVAFLNSPSEGALASPFTYRETCNNGLVLGKTTQSGVTAKLEAFTNEKIDEFLEKLEQLETKEFNQMYYSQRVRELSRKSASYQEVHQYRKLVHSLLKGDEMDHSGEAILDSFFPLAHIQDRYRKQHNINLAKYTAKAKRNVRTDLSLWALVNAVTEVASNDIGHLPLQKGARPELKREAGKLFDQGTHDADHILPQVV